MAAKIKSGRSNSIEMLIKVRKYQQAKADKKWIDGMIKAHTLMLIQNCSTKQDGIKNKREIPKDVRYMIADYFSEHGDLDSLRLLKESCLLFKIIPSDSEYIKRR